jgi:hypothetical protein
VTDRSSSDGLRSVLIMFTDPNRVSRSSARHYSICDARIREGSRVANSSSACTRCLNPTRQYCRVNLHSGRWYVADATFSSDMDLTVRTLVWRCNRRPAVYLLSIECAKLCCRDAAHHRELNLARSISSSKSRHMEITLRSQYRSTQTR